jgi:hypothetical protein
MITSFTTIGLALEAEGDGAGDVIAKQRDVFVRYSQCRFGLAEQLLFEPS